MAKAGDKVRISYDGEVMFAEGGTMMVRLDGETQGRWFTRDRMTAIESWEGPAYLGFSGWSVG